MCKEKYINPFTDFGFKRLFGTEANKDILIHFLNSVLDDEEPIVSVTYENPETLGIRPHDRRAIFDIYCTTADGSHIIVEMQNGRQEHFIERSIFYTAQAITAAAKKGKWNYDIPRIYTIAILNFHSQDFAGNPAFKHTVRLCDLENRAEFSDKITLIYLEAKKFNKGIDELETLADKWMYVIRNMYKLDAYPTKLKDAIFRKIFDESKVAAFNDAELSEYEDSLKVLRDNQNIVDTAYDEGKAEGKEEGLIEGKAEGKEERNLEIARAMKSKGYSISAISDLTGLTPTEIENL